ncbi:MAG: diacylglycerol kinase family lipid kinase [Candidatus Aminicenantes bacterium]|nr:diacylglycerol kinase family lipid kinase [Candidatus Aminicenantes bacterium]
MKKIFKTQVIVNPASAKGETRKRWGQIREGLRHFIHEFKIEFTERPFQANEIARSSLRDGAELIIGVGGDGTLNEIANGFYDNEKPINAEATLGIVPSGSGCDLTRSLKIPSHLKGAMAVLQDAGPVPIDIGKVSFRSTDGLMTERYFLNVADFGLGGEVIREVNRRRLERRASSYVKCLVSTILHYRNKKVRIRIDGRDLPREEYMIGAIANGRVFGKGMKIAPKAQLDDGLFDAVLVKGMKLFEFCRQGWKLINGSHLGYRKVQLIRGRRVEAVPEDEEESILLEMDGEQLGSLPAVFELIPRGLLVKGYL